VLAVSALHVDAGSLGAERAGADDDTRNSDEMGDIGRGKTTDRGLRDGGVDKELVLRESFGESEVFLAS
jgi:hypothetical protein